MKKTAFLLVLALLLQILLPPSMAGNVYAASTEEVAQTQAADGDFQSNVESIYYSPMITDTIEIKQSFRPIVSYLAKKQVITIICGMDMR